MNLYHLLYEREGAPQTFPEKCGPKMLWFLLRNEFWTLIGANVLFWLCCLPVVTIPAALRALSRVTVLLLRDQPFDLWPEWKSAFCAEFLRTTAIGAGAAAVGGLLVCGIRFYGLAMRENGLLAAPMLLLALTLAVLVMALFSLFPLLACSELKGSSLFRSALLLTLLRLPQNLAALASIAALAGIYWLLYPNTAVLLPSLLFSLGALFAGMAAWPGMAKYVFRLHETGEASA